MLIRFGKNRKISYTKKRIKFKQSSSKYKVGKKKMEPKEAFPYKPPSQDILDKYRSIIEYDEAYQRGELKERLISSYQYFFCCL